MIRFLDSLKVFIATFPYTSSDAGHLSLAVGDQVLVHSDGGDSLEWLHGEGTSGQSGWFPRGAGQLMDFAAGESSVGLTLEPLDGGTQRLGL
jgi:hypothetical protein